MHDAFDRNLRCAPAPGVSHSEETPLQPWCEEVQDIIKGATVNHSNFQHMAPYGVQCNQFAFLIVEDIACLLNPRTCLQQPSPENLTVSTEYSQPALAIQNASL